jgi:hypothetical protein
MDFIIQHYSLLVITKKYNFINMDFVNKKDKYTFNLWVLRNFHSSLEMILDLYRVKFKVAQ